MALVTHNPFQHISAERLAPRSKPRVFDKTQKVYVLIPKAVKVDNDPENVVIHYEPVLKEEFDINEYVASFADDVGIRNILKKLALSGDKSILNQTGREALCPDGGLEPIQDYSNAPKNKTEAFNSVVKGVQAFDDLPEDIKGKMSLTQFVQLFGQEEFDNYIKGVMAANASKEENK